MRTSTDIIIVVIEIRGITIPVIAVKIKERRDLSALKKALKEKVRGKLFKGSYVIIENAKELPEGWVRELESFLGEISLESVKKVREGQEGRLLIVRRSLRSGQKVEHGGDVLVLGDVNKDAEVVAVGNIIVMGTLRGIARAGALGDESAVVVALRMEPQQIRIGKKLAVSEDSERVSPGYPELARVEDGMIVLEKV